MKRLLILLLLLVPVCAFAADNLTGLSQSGKSVMVKDGFGFIGEVVTANATVAEKSGMVINRATNATATINYIPRVGQFFAIAQRDAHTATATVTLPTSWTWNGTNKSITFNAAAEALIGFVPYTGRVIIVENVGGVGFAD